MADKRKGRKKKEDSEPEKPSKEDYNIAKHLRFNCPSKKSTLFGQKVDYFLSSKAIDCLLDSKWAVSTKKKEATFTSRDSVVSYMDKLLMFECFFHRASKLVKTVPIVKKKKKKEEEDKGEKEGEVRKRKGGEKDKDSERDSAGDEGKKGDVKDKEEERDEEKSSSKKEKKKVKLEPHKEQIFIDGNEVYVWTYDPVSTKTFIIGLLILLGAIAVCLFPLWPPEIRSGVYYLSLSGIGLIGGLLGLSILRYILYGIVWFLTIGKLHFWLLPNLDADCGFKESFMPLYEYEMRTGKTCDEHKKDEKATDANDSSTPASGGTNNDNIFTREGGEEGGGSNDMIENNDDDFEVIEESDMIQEDKDGGSESENVVE